MAQPKDGRIKAKETHLSALMMLLGTIAQQALQVVLDDYELMTQVENSLPKMIKSMSKVEEEVGEMKSL